MTENLTTGWPRRAPDWATAHRLAYSLSSQVGPPGGARTARVALADATGRVLAAPLTTSTPLPAFDTSAMDGWAVAGSPPWRVVGEVLAGSRSLPLDPGAAVVIATGAEVPRGADAVLRSEDGDVADSGDGAGLLTPTTPGHPAHGRDIRSRGEEAKSGEQVLTEGVRVTPAVVSLAASCGRDELEVSVPPVVDVLILGDELLVDGPPREGRIRDSLGPALPGWIRGVGAELATVRRVPDDLSVTRDAIADTTGAIVITTGGTAHGPVDHVHASLDALGATLLIDTVAVRPGHPMLLARLPDGRWFVGLPGYPLSAAIAAVTLLRPLVNGMTGLAETAIGTETLTDATPAPPEEHRMVPAVREDGGRLRPLAHQGSGMLRGLAAADVFALVAPGGAAAGERVGLVPLPW